MNILFKCIADSCTTDSDCVVLGLSLLPGYGTSFVNPICVNGKCRCTAGYGFGNVLVLGVVERVCVRL